MKKYLLDIFLILTALALLGGCSSDPTTGPEPIRSPGVPEFNPVGDWTGTLVIESGNTLDRETVPVTFTFGEDRFSYTVMRVSTFERDETSVLPKVIPVYAAGKYRVEGEFIHLFDLSLSGNLKASERLEGTFEGIGNADNIFLTQRVSEPFRMNRRIDLVRSK